MITTEDGPTQPVRKRKWKILRRALLIVLLLIVSVMGGVVFLLRSQTPQWKEHQRFLSTHSTAQIEQLAAGAEKTIEQVISGDIEALLAQSSSASASPDAKPATAPGASNGDAGEEKPIDPTMIRIDEVRKLSLTRDELAALVTARYEQWLDSRGYVKPAELTEPMIQPEGAQLVAAFKFVTRGFSQVFTARFDLVFHDDGYATLKLDSLQAGRMPIPAAEVSDYLRKNAGNSALAAGEWLSKLEDLRFKPVLDDLPYRRRARVLGFNSEGEIVELTIRVQDFRTYAETNARQEAQMRTAEVATGF
ncbi:MAG: hypothetical protein IT445_07185 [Phycisphaeraceae bacterium]|nr:hypothetical protein [Phycisphaeraceae bacterium]